MATDCKKLSKNAQKIFDKLKSFFPPDSWKKPQWMKCGKIRDSTTWYDLRKSADRNKCIEQQRHTLGYSIGIKANAYIDKHKSLSCFYEEKLGMMISNMTELLLIFEELDYQIETGDLVD